VSGPRFDIVITHGGREGGREGGEATLLSQQACSSHSFLSSFPLSLPRSLLPFLPDEGVDLGRLDVVKLLDGGLQRKGGREGGRMGGREGGGDFLVVQIRDGSEVEMKGGQKCGRRGWGTMERE